MLVRNMEEIGNTNRDPVFRFRVVGGHFFNLGPYMDPQSL